MIQKNIFTAIFLCTSIQIFAAPAIPSDQKKSCTAPGRVNPETFEKEDKEYLSCIGVEKANDEYPRELRLSLDSKLEKTTASVSARFKNDVGDTDYHLGLEGAFKEDDEHKTLSSLDRLAAGTTIKLGATRHFFIDKNLKQRHNVNGLCVDLRKKDTVARNALRAVEKSCSLPQPPDKESCLKIEQEAAKANQALQKCIDEKNSIDPIKPELSVFSIGLTGKYNSTKFEWTTLDDPAKGEKSTKGSGSAELTLGYIGPSLVRYTLGLEYSDAYKASGEKQNICFPSTTNNTVTVCNNTVIGAPNSKINRIVSLGARMYLGDKHDYAMDLNVRQNLNSHEIFFQMPFYIFGVKDKRALQGGIALEVMANRKDKDGKNIPDEAAVRVFFSKPFSLF